MNAIDIIIVLISANIGIRLGKYVSKKMFDREVRKARESYHEKV